MKTRIKKITFIALRISHDFTLLILAPVVCFFGFFHDAPPNIQELLINIGLLFFGTWAFLFIINGYITGSKYDRKYKEILVNNAQFVGLVHPLFSGPTLIKFPAVRAQFYAAQLAFPCFTMNNFVYRGWFKGDNLRKEANILNYILAYSLCLSAFFAVSFVFIGAIIKLFVYLYGVI